MALTLQESLANLEKIASEYQSRQKQDLDDWVRWGHALIDHREAYEREKNREISKKEMRAICKKVFGKSAPAGYRWISFAKHESRIRHRLAEQNRDCADQREYLDWISEWEGRTTNGKPKDRPEPPACPNCNRAMGKKLVKELAARSSGAVGAPLALPDVAIPDDCQGPLIQDLTVRLDLTAYAPAGEIMEKAKANKVRHEVIVTDRILDEATDAVLAEGGLKKLVRAELILADGTQTAGTQTAGAHVSAHQLAEGGLTNPVRVNVALGQDVEPALANGVARKPNPDNDKYFD